MVTETLDEKGFVQSRSITERETTLIDVDEDGVTLRLEVLEEVAGKRFVGEPKTIKQGFHGELVCQELKVSEADAGQVVIEGLEIPCRIVRLDCTTPTGKTVTNVYYSTSVKPYILRRESVTTDIEGENTLGKTSVEVRALNMPCLVMTEIKNGAYVRAIRRHTKGTVTTWLVTSTDVPGGVISHSSKEVDKDRRLIRRSMLQLTDYGLESAGERTGLFGRKRLLPRRPTRPSLQPAPP